MFYRFIGSLVWKGINHGADTFFYTDIAGLAISDALRERLKKFGGSQISFILQLKPREAVKDPGLFKLIMDAEVVLGKEELADQQKRKGGGKKALF